MLNELNELGELKRIPIQNIYYMLVYVFKYPELKSFKNLDKNKFDNIYEIFALLLNAGIGQLVKQGLYRDYINICDDMPVLRGKIDIAGTIKHKVARRMLLSCEYDEFSENILLNQILKTTVMLLLQKDEVGSEIKAELKKVMRYFSDIAVIDHTSIPWRSINFHQNNRLYQSLIRICEFIIKKILLSHKPGDKRLPPIDDIWQLSALYESFLRAYYEKEFGKYLDVEFQSRMRWFPKEKNKRERLLPVLKPDLILSDKKEPKKNILIMDAKFYDKGILDTRTWKSTDDAGNEKIRSHATVKADNLYQIFSYVQNKSAYEDPSVKISGMLLYAATTKEPLDEPVISVSQLTAENDIAETYQTSGKFDIFDKDIYVLKLNLDQDFSGIKRDLNLIVEKIFKIKKEV